MKYFILDNINNAYFYGKNDWGNYDWGLNKDKAKIYALDNIESDLKELFERYNNIVIGIK
jgi:hypothetical protein